MLNISHAGCFDLSLTVSLQFTTKMCTAAQNRQKITKIPYFKVQDRSRSLILMSIQGRI